MSFIEIFPEGSFERKGHYEDAKGNAIALTVPRKQDSRENGVALEIEGDGRARRHLITDELEELGDIQDTDFTIMSPISYFGRQRSGRNARYLYAIVFDLDGVGMPQLRDTLHQMDKDIHSQSDLYRKQRNRTPSVLCADGADPYVPAKSENFERTEIRPHPADLEQVYFVHQGAADAGHFAGVPCGWVWLKVGARLSCGSLPIRRCGRSGEAAGLYS